MQRLNTITTNFIDTLQSAVNTVTSAISIGIGSIQSAILTLFSSEHRAVEPISHRPADISAQQGQSVQMPDIGHPLPTPTTLTSQSELAFIDASIEAEIQKQFIKLGNIRIESDAISIPGSDQKAKNENSTELTLGKRPDVNNDTLARSDISLKGKNVTQQAAEESHEVKQPNLSVADLFEARRKVLSENVNRASSAMYRNSDRDTSYALQTEQTKLQELDGLLTTYQDIASTLTSDNKEAVKNWLKNSGSLPPEFLVNAQQDNLNDEGVF